MGESLIRGREGTRLHYGHVDDRSGIGHALCGRAMLDAVTVPRDEADRPGLPVCGRCQSALSGEGDLMGVSSRKRAIRGQRARARRRARRWVYTRWRCWWTWPLGHAWRRERYEMTPTWHPLEDRCVGCHMWRNMPRRRP